MLYLLSFKKEKTKNCSITELLHFDPFHILWLLFNAMQGLWPAGQAHPLLIPLFYLHKLIRLAGTCMCNTRVCN